MIKKTKDYPKQIADNIQKALDYNKSVKEPFTPITVTTIDISKGLYNAVRNNGIEPTMILICKELGINYRNAPFEIVLYDNGDYWQMFIKYK